MKTERCWGEAVQSHHLQSQDITSDQNTPSQGTQRCRAKCATNYSQDQTPVSFRPFFACTVLPGTSSEGTKVKISGVMMSEVAGHDAGTGIRNAGAVEYTHDISARSDKGMFDIRNHA